MSTKTLRVEEKSITYSARMKVYPDGSIDLLVCERGIFRAEGWENPEVSSSRKVRKRVRSPPSQPEPGEPSRAMRRARAQVRELAKANNFRYFVTLTLDAAVVDRYDIAAITKRLNVWLDNNVRRRGLAYVLVPEHHQDGAVHFHGLFNDALPVVPSGHKDSGGHEVYNLPRWGFGFSTAIELYGEYDRAVAYVCKYIGKQAEKVGGRWYYSGGDLKHPEVVYLDMALRDAMELPGAYCFTIEDAAASFVQVYFPPGAD